MYEMIRSLYQKFPETWKQALRPLIPTLLPLISRNERLRRRWIRQEYKPFHAGQREEIFLSIARFCNANRPIEGYYFEFGSYSGNTLKMAWKHTRHLFDWTYVSFDSFEGLPEISDKDKQEIWVRGKLAMTEEALIETVTAAGMPRDRLITVKGFYDQTLTPDLTRRLGGKKAAAIYIDCDLYSSTVPILNFIKDFLQIGTIIVFDDWNCFYGDPLRGERRAWQEFLYRNPDLRFTEFVRTCEANSFIYLGNAADQKHIEGLYAQP